MTEAKVETSSHQFYFEGILEPSGHLDVLVSCASGFEHLLEDELCSLIKAFNQKYSDVPDINTELNVLSACIELKAPLAFLYYVCLWSRLAEQVLLKLAEFHDLGKQQDVSRETIYSGIKSIPWEKLFSLDKRFRIDFSGSQKIFSDNRFLALVCKDAVADRFRFHFEQRPSVAKDNPDVIVQIFGDDYSLQVYLNVSGDKLHKRGYRHKSVEAPLKETLAAALLYQMQWHNNFKQHDYFVDPCCGSGTLAIEALLMAVNCAPNLLRAKKSALANKHRNYSDHDESESESENGAVDGESPSDSKDDSDRDFSETGFGFESLSFFNEQHWQSVLEAAGQSLADGLAIFTDSHLKIRAYDSSMHAIKAAKDNLFSLTMLLGSKALIHFEKRSFFQLSPLKINESKQTNSNNSNNYSNEEGKAPRALGTIICNPPYGERLQSADELKYLYHFLGDRVQSLYPNWHFGVICNQVELLDQLSFGEYQQARFNNGNLKCLFRYGVQNKSIEAKDVKEAKNTTNNYFLNRADVIANFSADEHAEFMFEGNANDFKNRLLKNLKKLRAWLSKESISNFRLYDADLPEFNAAIDCYQGHDSAFAVVSEYAPPKSIDPDRAAQRFQLLVHTLRQLFDLQREQVFIKKRSKQKGKDQYSSKTTKAKQTKLLYVEENNLNFLINPYDYLDIGLFIDHRRIRRRIFEQAHGKRFLNLFAYTGSASVHAAAGGARSTLSVDLSENYLTWARKNFLANGFSLASNKTQQGDVIEFLKNNKDQFDVIFVDPPTFSNSKKKHLHFDIQKDHQELIILAMARLDGDGTLYFSTNFRGFVFSEYLAKRYQVNTITHDTQSFDFKRKPPHNTWKIQRRVD